MICLFTAAVLRWLWLEGERARCTDVTLVGERERGRCGLWPGGRYIKQMVVVLCHRYQRDELGWNSNDAWWVVRLEQPGHFRVVGYNYRVPFGG